jgi:hypothetical protein
MIHYFCIVKLREGKEKEFQRNKDRNIGTFTLLPILLHPKSRGTIRLQSSDPFDPPLIDPNYFDHQDDIKEYLRGLKIYVLWIIAFLHILFYDYFQTDTPCNRSPHRFFLSAKNSYHIVH